MQVGGTVGDIESMVFLEALRQLQFIVSPENLFFIHVSLVPVLGTSIGGSWGRTEFSLFMSCPSDT